MARWTRANNREITEEGREAAAGDAAVDALAGPLGPALRDCCCTVLSLNVGGWASDLIQRRARHARAAAARGPPRRCPILDDALLIGDSCYACLEKSGHLAPTPAAPGGSRAQTNRVGMGLDRFDTHGAMPGRSLAQSPPAPDPQSVVPAALIAQIGHRQYSFAMLVEIKNFVATAIRERDESPDPRHRASHPWQYGASLISYLRQLDEHELRFLRRHTFHFTGDVYQRYACGTEPDRQRVVDAARYIFSRLPGFRLDEGPYGIGYQTEFGLISSDFIRYLSVLADLIDNGSLRRNRRQTILEIGGGYGGLARAVVAYQPDAAYVLCDLEETLFCSAVHLRNTMGGNRVHLCTTLGNQDLQPGHFYCVPQSRLDDIEVDFDLAVNHQSMQEMETAQVARYCDYVEDRARVLYSRNYPSLSCMRMAERMTEFDQIKDLNSFLRRRFPVLWVGSKETAVFGDAWLERLLLSCAPCRAGA